MRRAAWTVQVHRVESSVVLGFASYTRARRCLTEAEVERQRGSGVVSYQLFDCEKRCLHDSVDDGPADIRLWPWAHLGPGHYVWDPVGNTLRKTCGPVAGACDRLSVHRSTLRLIRRRSR